MYFEKPPCQKCIELLLFYFKENLKMSRILVCGDIHADLENVKELFRLAILGKCERIHCVGDFGFFPNLPQCSEFYPIYLS